MISGVVYQTLDAVCFYVTPEEEQDCKREREKQSACARVCIPEVAQWATALPADAES